MNTHENTRRKVKINRLIDRHRRKKKQDLKMDRVLLLSPYCIVCQRPSTMTKKKNVAQKSITHMNMADEKLYNTFVVWCFTTWNKKKTMSNDENHLPLNPSVKQNVWKCHFVHNFFCFSFIFCFLLLIIVVFGLSFGVHVCDWTFLSQFYCILCPSLFISYSILPLHRHTPPSYRCIGGKDIKGDITAVFMSIFLQRRNECSIPTVPSYIEQKFVSNDKSHTYTNTHKHTHKV